MSPEFIIIAIGLVGGVVGLATMWHRSNDTDNLGSVSHQWIAEHRLGGRDHEARR
jgi:hypothetical protein